MTTSAAPRRPQPTPTAVTVTRGDGAGLRIPFGTVPAEWTIHAAAVSGQGGGGTLREWFESDGGAARDGDDVVLDTSDSVDWAFEEARLLVEFTGPDGAGTTRGPIWLMVTDR